MRIAVYPGSFDLITYGHVDVIQRASVLFDKVYLVIMHNPEKTGTFSMEERLEMANKVLGDYENVEVLVGEGLTINMAQKLGASFLVRGIRAVTDYEYELQLAAANMALAPNIETVFFLTKPENSFLSSSIARMIAKNGGNLEKFVPEIIREEVMTKLSK